MNSNNNGSGNLGEDNSSLSQDPAQTITITIMEPSSALGDTVDRSSVSVSNLNSSHLNSVVSSGSGITQEEATSAVISEKPEHILQTSISKTQLEEEFPVISNISNPEEEESLGQEVTKESEIYDEEVDIAASSDPHCLVCNKELPQNTDDTPVAIFQVQTTATQRKMSVMLGVLVGQKITSRKSHSDLLCSRCYNLLDKVDSLEIELQDTKDDLINNYQSTYAIYGGRPRRKKAATAKKKEFVFPKIEPDEIEREDSLEFDSNFEPRAEDLLEEEADQQEDLVASGALDDEWEPEFKKPKLKRENTDADGGVAPKRRRGRPRKDITKAKVVKHGTEITTLTTSGEPSTNSRRPLPSRRIVTVPDTFRKCPHCPIIFFHKHDINKHVEKEHTQHKQQRECQRCNQNFDTYEYNNTCDKCLNALRQNIVEHSKNNDDILIVMGQNFTENSRKGKNKGTKAQLFCKDCKIEYPSKMILDLHYLSTGHGIDSDNKTVNMKGEDFTSLDKRAHHFNSQNLQVEKETMDKLVIKDENSVSDRVNVNKNTSSVEFRRKKSRIRQYSNRRNIITCEICGQDFNSKTSRYGHMRSEHPSSFQFECCICEERFIRESVAKEHEKHHVVGELHCPACSMRFTHMSHLQNHTRKNHPNFSHFPCQYCKSVTPSVEALHSHIKIHHGDCLGLPDAFPCGICSEVFHTGTAVSAHRSNYHPGTTFCTICNTQVSKRYLKKHVNAVHTKEKTHSCVSCDKFFFSRTSLNNHRKRHHAARKHLCHLCGKGYVFNVELQRHLKAHRNQRDFKCDFCGRSFLKAGELTYHRRSHTGERPNKCSQCQETFVRPLALRKHIQNKHTENKKRKPLRYSKRKIDELASSVIMADIREENSQQQEGNHGALCEMTPLNLESSQLASIDIEKTRGLSQVFSNVNMAPNHCVQHSNNMAGFSSGESQILSIVNTSHNQLVSGSMVSGSPVVSGSAVSGAQLELSGAVEDELLEMSSDLLIDDVRETADENVADGNLRGVAAAASVDIAIRESQQRTGGELVTQQTQQDEQAQTQPVQVIYVQFDSLY